MGDPEDVAYWFFRLNGCLTIRNFIVHPDRRGPARTDADLLVLRFPARQEQNMADAPIFAAQAKPTLYMVEVKATGICRLNGPWTEAPAGNLTRVLHAIGCYRPEETGLVAGALYTKGNYVDGAVDCFLVALASQENGDPDRPAPGALQLQWDDVLAFIHDRFRLYRAQKANHPQWDWAGQLLYRIAQHARDDREAFGTNVMAAFFPGSRR